MDFLHVDNMVQAHVCAAKALTADKNYIAVSLKFCESQQL